jgi:hypothetical protein
MMRRGGGLLLVIWVGVVGLVAGVSQATGPGGAREFTVDEQRRYIEAEMGYTDVLKHAYDVVVELNHALSIVLRNRGKPHGRTS